MQKSVLITGVSGGIGAALLEKFVSENYFVVGQYCRNFDKIREFSTKYSDSCVFFGCDFTSPDETERFAKNVNERFTFDCLINNAGTTHTSLFQNDDNGVLQKTLFVNLLSPMIVTRETIKKMISFQTGSIVNISSIWGVYGGSTEVTYSATKGGLIAFTKALAKEVGLSGVRVNALACGFIDTPMTSAYKTDEREAFAQTLSLPRIGTPKEVAEAAYFLCSDAASYITGQVLGVDGGF